MSHGCLVEMAAPTGFEPILLESESSILPIILRSIKVVVSQGFAPRLSPSKGDVLLLHHETAKNNTEIKITSLFFAELSIAVI